MSDTGQMEMIELETLPTGEIYKLLTGLVIPRPIAWMTTLSDNGRVNAAPFSYFNVFGSSPPMVIIGTGRKPEGRLKDTAHNLRERKLGVLHLVEENMAQSMVRTSASLPHGESEISFAGLEVEESAKFPVPAIKGTRLRMHCELMDQPVYGDNLLNVLKILRIEMENRLRTGENGSMNPDFAPLGRLGSNFYCHSRDRFQMERP